MAGGRLTARKKSALSSESHTLCREEGVRGKKEREGTGKRIPDLSRFIC